MTIENQIRYKLTLNGETKDLSYDETLENNIVGLVIARHFLSTAVETNRQTRTELSGKAKKLMRQDEHKLSQTINNLDYFINMFAGNYDHFLTNSVTKNENTIP